MIKTLKFRSIIPADATPEEVQGEISFLLQSFADFRNIADTKLVAYQYNNLFAQVETVKDDLHSIVDFEDVSYNSAYTDGVDLYFFALVLVDGETIILLDEDEE